MITRPSTPRVLADVATELEREIMPLLTDTVAQVKLHMIMTVLGHCAVRSGNETAWMTEETALYLGYAEAVSTATGSEAVRAATAEVTPFDDLRLDAVAENYSRAGEAMSVAIETAMDAGLDELVARGEDLLALRIANEQAITSSSAMVGR